MKTALLAAVTTAVLLSTPAQADNWPNPDLYGDILHDVQKADYVGTSLPDTRKRLFVSAPNPHFPNPDVDETGYVIGTAGPEKGYGDEYGSIMFDIGARR